MVGLWINYALLQLSAHGLDLYREYAENKLGFPSSGNTFLWALLNSYCQGLFNRTLTAMAKVA